VGIRTASPAEPLTVDNSSGVTTGAIRIYAIDQSHSRLAIQNGNGQAYHLVAGNPGASNAGFALYDNTAGATRYYVDNTGVQTWQNVGGVAGTAMTLNSNGLGVGVTPSAWGSTYKAAQLTGGASVSYGTGTMAVIQNSYDSAAGSFRYVAAASSAASFYQQTAGTHEWSNASAGTAGNLINGGTGAWTSRMLLDASGNLLVGSATNTNSSRVFIRNGSAASPSLALQGITGDTNQAGLLVGKFDNDSTSAQILVRFTINNNAGGSGQINANGASQAAFGSYSDSRLKENIVSLPSQLANILSLRPVEFDYKDGSGHQIGFVAQEIQKVYSDTVGEQDGFLTVTGWSKTEARLVSAIKELAAKVQALEAKLA
jgi:hypothetical protein